MGVANGTAGAAVAALSIWLIMVILYAEIFASPKNFLNSTFVNRLLSSCLVENVGVINTLVI